MIYIAKHCDHDDRVKIGHSGEVFRRVARQGLEALVFFPGGFDLEQHLHRRFHDLRAPSPFGNASMEWFWWRDPLVTFAEIEVPLIQAWHESDHPKIRGRWKIANSSLASELERMLHLARPQHGPPPPPAPPLTQQSHDEIRRSIMGSMS